jgi:hypothetical protein
MRNDDRICESDAKYELARRSLALGKVRDGCYGR